MLLAHKRALTSNTAQSGVAGRAVEQMHEINWKVAEVIDSNPHYEHLQYRPVNSLASGVSDHYNTYKLMMHMKSARGSCLHFSEYKMATERLNTALTCASFQSV